MPQEEPSGTHHRWSDAALDARPVVGHRVLRRLGWVLVVVLVLALMVVLPPLVNVGRYQRRIAQDISASIGRPVHFDDIHLHLLPLPGLTIQNFVMQEDPAFGVEPALRANTVEARLRLASLWRRRIEVSRIDLQAPSINLVRGTDGRWNFQGVVTQAGTITSAPTAQRRAGVQPRFPYIEASDARINVKLGDAKLPWSLVDADLALWLPDATEWRVRLRGRPLRTDTDVSDVGELHIEGSLGRDASGQSAGLMSQPLALAVRWAPTPLGEAAKLLLGRDTGLRGSASAELELRGTPAHMQLSTDLHLHNLRRAEFVPRLPMSVNAHCIALADSDSHALANLRCAIPTAQSSGLFEGMFHSSDEQILSASDVLTIQGQVPDILDPTGARVTAKLVHGDPAYLLNWLRVASSRIPAEVSASGAFTVRAGWNVPAPADEKPQAPATSSAAAGGSSGWYFQADCKCVFAPRFTPAQADPDLPAVKAYWVITATQAAPDGVGTAAKSSTSTPATIDHAIRIVAMEAASADPDPQSTDVPATNLPGTQMAATLSTAGLDMSYSSAAVERYAATLMPPLGDNLPQTDMPPTATAPAISSTRVWGQPQQWTESASTFRPAQSRRTRRRH